VAAAALVSAPLIYFRSEIGFDAALFTTEWLKIVFSSIILFAVVDILLHRQREYASEQLLQRIVSEEVATPLREAVRLLVSAREAATANPQFAATSVCRELRPLFQRVRAALFHAPFIATTSRHVISMRHLADAFTAYDWERRLDEFTDVSEWHAASIDELSAMIVAITDLLPVTDL
jgi:hypothetical protein